MFFERFELLCKKKGISPSKAGEEIGFSKSSVSTWRKDYMLGNDKKPSMKIAKRIAEYFDVSLDYLLGHHIPDPVQEFDEEYRPRHVLRDRTPISLIPRPTLTDNEVLLIDAYRQHPELQALVNQALGIADLIEDEDEKA